MGRGSIAIALALCPMQALAAPQVAEVASCAALIHAMEIEAVTSPPYAIVAGGSDLAFAFYSEAHLLSGRDTDGLNALIEKLMPRYMALRNDVIVDLDQAAMAQAISFRQTEQSRCDTLGAEMSLTRRFYADGPKTLFPLPDDRATDPNSLAYAMGWYGASCLGHELALVRVTRELDIAVEQPTHSFDINTLLAEPTGWTAVDLMLLAQERADFFAAAARVVLPLHFVGADLPDAETTVLRQGQSECQDYARLRNLLASLEATP